MRENTEARWSTAWPDALAFAFGLGLALVAGWTTTDLVWSLWLSSLVVGYAMIVWTIARPGVDILRGVIRERELAAQAIRGSKGVAAVRGSILVGGGLVALAFFTVHFGGFHYVHSQFLHGFFPLDGNPTADGRLVGGPDYAEVVRRYWTFLPAAFLAERAGFARPSGVTKDDLSVTATAIAARKAANARKGAAMLVPYRNVLRMHFLIFFFAFAHFTHVDNFFVYTVVYAAYFFPWRLLKQPDSHGAAIDVS
ncbi:MAG: DUF6498-containing protein [Gemmatimonadota bacterium]|nr:DUF6498-containing protein [Gemmatimonadota bacterium]